MSRKQDSELLAVFRRETEELIASAEQALLELEKDSADAPSLKTLFRNLHSLKGNAACIPLPELENFVHDAESILHPVRERELVLTSDLLNAIFKLIYAIRDSAVGGSELPPELLDVLRGRVAAAPGTVEKSARQCYRVTLQYPGELLPPAFDLPVVIADLTELGTILRVSLDERSILPLEALGNPDALNLRYVVEIESGRNIDEVRQGCFVFDDVIRVNVEPVETSGPRPGNGGDSENRLGLLRIESDKIDRLLNLAGEMTISNSRLKKMLADGAPAADLLEAAELIERQSRQIQDDLLGVRMIEIEALFRPFVRMVRELATSLGKSIRFTTVGEEVELDKTIVEQMREPLTHMIRNAADHGIETPAERVAAGKPPEGRIILKAEQREGSIYIEVTDDGRGLNRAKLRERAIERGILDPHAELTDQQLDSLIFESGLSTASQVTNVSGRGVGMDIVRRSIEQIRGEVRVRSEEGKGTTFFVRLPLTLALLDGIVVRDQTENYIVPLLTVEEAVAVKPGQLRQMAGQGAFISLRGESLPTVRLSKPLGSASSEEIAQTSGICVILRFEERRIGILVEDVIDQRQFVIKSLDENYRRVDGFTGATIVGDGRVALIVDVPALVRTAVTPDGHAMKEIEGGATWSN